jgi:hypothetical protein
MSAEHKLLKNLYEAFNARDIELALSGMHPDVDWANGMEGGSVHGRKARTINDSLLISIDPAPLGSRRTMHLPGKA